MKIYVGITDYDWYELLKNSECDEVNFWKPGGNTNFKVLHQNEMFLFKLHSPYNYIVGGGFFVRFSILPSYLAWESFGTKNGVKSLKELNERIMKYRKNFCSKSANLNIGCIILTQPFFFEKRDWIAVPDDWKSGIMQGKTYSTDHEIGNELYSKVIYNIKQIAFQGEREIIEPNIDKNPKYNEYLTKHRLGQGGFRVSVLEAYQRRCAMTGEKTLPVLDAAHIKPYSSNGEHEISNGLLLRKDLHTLFDQGYITVDTDYRVNVSKRLNEDFGNGKIYYAIHGNKLVTLPTEINLLPSKNTLEWHNENIYLG